MNACLFSSPQPLIVGVVEIVAELRSLHIVMEYLPGGTLSRLIRTPDGRAVALAEPLARHILLQLATAVGYLHGRKIAHRDLKPSNVLLDNSQQWPTAKLCDFGISKLHNGGSQEMRSMCGSPKYLAPKLIPVCQSQMSMDNDSHKYSSEVRTTHFNNEIEQNNK